MNRRDLFKLSGLVFATSVLTKAHGATKLVEELSSLEEIKSLTKTPLQLHYNENSLGISPKAIKAIKETIDTVNRYPDQYIEDLTSVIANHFNLKAKQVTLGVGSSDIIRALINQQAYKAKLTNTPIQLITPDPSFSLAADHAKDLQIPVVNVPLDDKMAMDLEAMKKAADQFNGISICYLCNPNNPTGSLTPSLNIKKWIENAPEESNFFIVDEAYAEFITEPNFESGLSFVNQGRDNVMVLRTFSKIYAMAGLRVGYGLATEKLSKEVLPFMAILNISSLSAVAAIVSMQDVDFVNKSISNNNDSKLIVNQALNELDLDHSNSQGNFVFHKLSTSVDVFADRMLAQGILVGRAFPPYNDYCRVTLGTPKEMKQYVTVLKEFRQKGWI